jgi:predicted phage terminase large subunit-like protein
MSADIRMGPQPGPQLEFNRTPADIAICGGGAGGGKTWGLIWECLRHLDKRCFGAVIFRRELPQITNPGGLWDKSHEIFHLVGGRAREAFHDWLFPSGARVSFAHLQRDDDRYSWDGTEISLICFDQLESFSWCQFTYLLSRNRSTCGVNPYIRATCNPDPDHWLRGFLSWWIDDETGLAIPERSGVIRYWVNLNNENCWGDSVAELRDRLGPEVEPKSVTFIHSTVYDNKILLKKNPQYLANLKAMQHVDRERLLGGNWDIRDIAGSFFKKEWFEIVNAAPVGVDEIRYWDRAATEAGKAGPRASWTVGVLLRRCKNNVFYVIDVKRFQGSPLTVETTIKNTATQDGPGVRIGIEQDPGQASKAEAYSQVRNLAGFVVRLNAVHEAKGVRARPVSAQAEAGNIKIVRGGWNDAYLNELENFSGSDNCVADQVDATSGAFHMLTIAKLVAERPVHCGVRVFGYSGPRAWPW